MCIKYPGPQVHTTSSSTFPFKVTHDTKMLATDGQTDIQTDRQTRVNVHIYVSTNWRANVRNIHHYGKALKISKVFSHQCFLILYIFKSKTRNAAMRRNQVFNASTKY